MRLTRILGIVLVAVLAIPVSLNAATDSRSVKAAFNGYKAAIMNDRGQEAAGLLSSSTAEYYEQMRDLALYATREDLMKQSTINLMQALSMRHRMPPGELEGMSGSALLVYAIDHGWIGKSSVASLELKDVNIVGDTAVAEIVADQHAGSVQFRFRRENGEWRLDLLPIIQAGSVALDALAKQQGVTREELVFTLLSAVSGSQVGESVWNPPLAAAGAVR